MSRKRSFLRRTACGPLVQGSWLRRCSANPLADTAGPVGEDVALAPGDALLIPALAPGVRLESLAEGAVTTVRTHRAEAAATALPRPGRVRNLLGWAVHSPRGPVDFVAA